MRKPEFNLSRNRYWDSDNTYRQCCNICDKPHKPGSYIISYKDNSICDKCAQKYVPDLFGVLQLLKYYFADPKDCVFTWRSKAEIDEGEIE